MNKSQIEVGGEYAVSLKAFTNLSSGIGGYAGKLAHVRVVEKDHEFEVSTFRNYSERKETKRGYLVEVVEPFSFESEGDTPPGERFPVETGREFVQPWDDYVRDLAAFRAEKAEAARVEDEARDRFRRISEQLAALDRIDAKPHRDGWRDSHPITGATLSLDALEWLLSAKQAATAVYRGVTATVEIDDDEDSDRLVRVRLIVEPEQHGLDRERYSGPATAVEDPVPA